MSHRARPAAARMKVSTRERVNRGDTAATDRRGTVATNRRGTVATERGDTAATDRAHELALSLGAD